MGSHHSEYNKKRNFNITSEPPDDIQKGKSANASARKKGLHSLRFVIQKHDASHLHYDFRLELDGTLKSWAVPKGPSLDPKEKRLAVEVEDHPMGYATFEGSIPKGQYGGGDVIVWDQGIWQPEGDAKAAYKSGRLKFTLTGEKLSGSWTLVRMYSRSANKTSKSGKPQWLLIKEQDEAARSAADYNILEERPESVITGDLLPADKLATSKSTSSETDPHSPKKSSRAAKKELSQVSTTTKAMSEKKAKAKISDKPIPSYLSPQLATLVKEAPDGDWLYEMKFDGYRILTRIKDNKIHFFSRNGHDWTERFPAQMETIKALHLTDSWLDGEVVVLKENGLPSFQLLQNAFDAGLNHRIIYYLFDAPFLNGVDMRKRPIEERRSELEKILANSGDSPVRFSPAFMADKHNIIESACALSLEGVIGKRLGSTYISQRSADWIKLKCRLRQEFVILGYTEPKGSRSGFGALLLGVYEDNKSQELLYAGRVGTGFDTNRLQDIYKKLRSLERNKSPLSSKLTGTQARGVHWVDPTLVCEVEFAEWTSEGILRQASFIALRTDKPAKDIVREYPRATDELPDLQTPAKNNTRKKPEAPGTRKKRMDVANISISHPDRVLDSESGKTKLELAQFYESISEFILPHLADRPVSLLRAPDGIGGDTFFQKHSDRKEIPHIIQLDQSLDPTHEPLMQIDNLGGLVGCVQMNTIEFHTWGSTSKAIETPNRFVLDLDPDPVLPWRSVIEGAQLILTLLDELKLTAFLKTTGGKGIHIVVPLTAEADWDYVKEFSKAISQFVAKQIPARFVAKMGPKNRVGKIFIDYLRNSRGASTVTAYSVRARPGLPISVPIARNELDKVSRPNYWNIDNLEDRLKRVKTPWGDYDGREYSKKQKLSKSMWKKLGVAPPITE